MFQRALCVLFFICLLAACDAGGPAAPTPPPTAPSATAAVPLPPDTVPPATQAAAPTVTAAAAPSVPATPAVPPVADTATRVVATATSAAAATTEPPAAVRSTATPVAASETVPPAPTPGTSATPAGRAPDATVGPATQQQLRTIETETAGLRGLQPKAAVPVHFISSTQMAANTKQEVISGYPRDQARQDALELWLLRLLDDRSIDLLQTQIDLLGEDVLGYYSPDSRELFVRNDRQPLDPQAQTTLSHEFTHALQDEYFNLNKLRPKDLHDNDRGTALTSLIEGDAVLEQTLFDLRYLSPAELQKLIDQSKNAPTAVFNTTPPYIRDSLLFPYESGVQFVATLYKTGGYQAVNQAFRDPPTSSEQILHPERYQATPRDTPLPVTVPPLTSTLGAGWTLKDTNDLGEFDLAEMLRVNGVGTPTPADPAAQPVPPIVGGWGGARFALYQGQASAVVLLVTRWDTPGDADSFATALQQSFAQATRTGALWTDNGRVFGIQHRGDQVVYGAGTDAGSVQRVLATVK